MRDGTARWRDEHSAFTYHMKKQGTHHTPWRTHAHAHAHTARRPGRQAAPKTPDRPFSQTAARGALPGARR
eukprot:3549471-Alexandrium_andersonii.AAC.1